ncbi:Lrp/AsnC family transcriptional regulator [Sphingomonas colocasiae]|uniref:Lrp/AsnC family transcriptional regulator n=1 Tax=Sphingomonas colocasiae TaxID=1848973 RepID=A0ABS7PTX1_9SPHN|nr:Lrp/AsnC family transcriptional regulator [Sphingomonas colocasiae]MBY8823439.1 Lrp/AsnC family transcriptional regulator [Sphingomonas colocasiae]
MTRNIIDSVDRKILTALQRDASIPATALAEVAGLTSTGCWRRIKRLEEIGVIAARVTLLSPQALGLGLTGYVMIRTRDHGDAWLRRFLDTVGAFPEVVEIHRTTGDLDYLLKIVARDLAAYNEIYRTISQLPDVTDVSAAFSMEAIKSTTELPLPR